MTNFTIGSTYSGFVLERVELLEAIHSHVYLFKHKVLGCRALAIKNKDKNKTFCVSFKTVPGDSTGVAHILEHSVLMGSEKYPVKDVFGEINKGGLTTFLNAMTGADTTWYPFATRNMKEYFNIMDVYCDVTFNPLLLRSTFEQEGWHYHLESNDEPLQYMGVVLNEMKGAYADPIRALFHHTFRGLMPESTYAHESGGAPHHIPDLSYEQFVEFHQGHYHPSNCTLFFYGDAPLEQELAYVQETFLASYQQPENKAVIVQGSDISQPVYHEDTYPVQPGSELHGKTFLAVSSTIGTVHHRRRNTAFQIIANILYNSDASPLKKAVFDSGLCKDFGGLFLSNSCFKTIMMTYLVGSDPDKKEAFYSLYQEVLSNLASNGLDRELVLSELNKYEFTVREEMNKAQRGLDLISKAMPMLKHDLDPFDALQIDEVFQEIRSRALEDGYFEDLIKTHLLDNEANVSVTLKPDPEKMQRTMESEQTRLADHANSLDTAGREQLVTRTQELMEIQTASNSVEDLRKLPRLTIGDLESRPAFHVVDAQKVDDRPLLISDLETNGITYIDIGFDCSGVDTDLLPYLDIFGTLITEIGTKGKDYMQFAKAVNLYTGGLNHSFNTYLKEGDRQFVSPIQWFHVKALSPYLDKAVDLMVEVLDAVEFSDRQRIREIVQREYAWAEHSVQSEGYSLASARVFSHLSRAGGYNEYVSGATSYLVLKDLSQNYQACEDDFLDRMHQLRDILFRRSALTLSVTGSTEDISRFKDLAPSITGAVVDRPMDVVSPVFPPQSRSQAFCTSAEIVYNVQGCTLFPSKEQYRGQFEVLKTWISRDYLWNTVRQLGGAYGCFIQFNHLTGNFGIVSYRDPQVQKTYDAYNALQQQVESLQLSNEMLSQLIIGTYGNFNPHQGPASLAASARNEYLSGITPEFKQARISEIISTTREDLRSFASFFTELTKTPYRTTIGNSARVADHKEIFDDIIEL